MVGTATILVLLAAHASMGELLPLYKDKSAPIPDRAIDLMKRMTLEEKVAQLNQPWMGGSPTAKDIFEQYNSTGIGAWYLSTINTQKKPNETVGQAMVRTRNEIQHLFVEKTRLGIPLSFITETLHSGGPGGTIFPMPVNYASSWNVSAVAAAARIIADEARACGTDRGYSPVINMFPDARYGRVQEGYSEDPYMTKTMGAAHLTSLQGEAMGGPETYLNNFTHALVGTVKHYAAYGMSAGGIDGSPADLSEQKLREVYLSPWEYLADGRGLRSVMAAQNMVNGRPMHANKRLLTTVLRNEWGVSAALVESDGPDCIGALQSGFHAVATRVDAAVLGLEAGMDMDLGGVTFATLVDAVKSNLTTEKEVERATYNVLVSKFASGVFDMPYTDESRVLAYDTPDKRALARETAEESMILLKNQNQTLPLDFKKVKSIALVGPLADSPQNTGGSYFNHGANIITVKDALGNATAKEGITLSFNVGANAENENDLSAIPAAVAAAKLAEVVVAVVGDTMSTCGEMVDRSSIDLPGSQIPLLEALVKTGTPVVVLLINGRPATFGRGNKVLDDIDALMVGWRPGEEGGPAFLNLLTGVVSPSGRLAQAWPRSVGGVGGPGAPYLYPFQGNHMGEAYSAGDGPSDSLFQFGAGLSYTAFDIANLTVSPAKTTSKGTFHLKMTATNTGSVDSAVPIQVYFRDPVSMPIRISSIQLIRFTKVFIPAGKTIDVEIDLKAADLAYWDDGFNDNGHTPGWVVDKGDFDLVIGTAGFTSWSNPEGLNGKVTVI